MMKIKWKDYTITYERFSECPEEMVTVHDKDGKKLAGEDLKKVLLDYAADARKRLKSN